MMHLWATAGRGTMPVCGAYGVNKGDVAMEFRGRDLCPACLGHQIRKSSAASAKIRTTKKKQQQQQQQQEARE